MNFFLLDDNAVYPSKAYASDAGFDLSSLKDYSIESGEWASIRTGVSVQLPLDTFGGIYSRSGLSRNRGLVVLQGTGVVDECYKGELIVLLLNLSKTTQVVTKGLKIAQLVVQPLYPCINQVRVQRGVNGFGSSDLIGDDYAD